MVAEFDLAPAFHMGALHFVDNGFGFGADFFEFVEEFENDFDTGEVDAELLGKVLDAAHALDIGFGVHADIVARALRRDEAHALVHAQGLRMRRDHFRHNRDLVNRLLAGFVCGFRLRVFVSRFAHSSYSRQGRRLLRLDNNVPTRYEAHPSPQPSPREGRGGFG
jgi:hypothetical protein